MGVGWASSDEERTASAKQRFIAADLRGADLNGSDLRENRQCEAALYSRARSHLGDRDSKMKPYLNLLDKKHDLLYIYYNISEDKTI